MSKLHPITFRLDPQTDQAISNAAKAAKKTKSEFLRRIFTTGYKQLVQDFRSGQPQSTPDQDIQALRADIAKIKDEQEIIKSDIYNQRDLLTDIYVMIEALATILGKWQEFRDSRRAMMSGRDLAYFYPDELDKEARALEEAEGRQ